MGTKVHCKSYLPGYHSMRDLNEDSSSSSWPLFYGEKPVINGHYSNGFTQGPLINGYSEKDALKQKMLEHEAVFKNQVCELHRLYKIQRDMMEEAKRKEYYKHRESLEPSSSSTLHGSQMPLDEARKWHMAGFPLLNSGQGKTGIEIINSPMSCTQAYNTAQQGQFPLHNGSTSKDFETMESRPLKVRKKLFDLQLPADEYLDNEDGEDSRGDIRLTDLNEPIQVEETKGINQTVGSNAGYLGVTRETNGFSLNSSIERSSKNNLSSVTQGRDMDKLPILNQVHHPNGVYPTGYNKDEHWRNGSHHGLESSDRTRDPFFNSCFPSSWVKPANILGQKLTTYGSSSTSAAGTSTSLPFGGKWQANGSSSRLFPGLRSELTSVNGFYNGSKELHVPGLDHLNCSRGENVNSTNNGVFENSQKAPFRADSRPVIDLNLNEVVSNEMQDLNTTDGKLKQEDDLSALPWLRPKPVINGNEASSDQFCSKNEKVVITSTDSEILRQNEIPETQNVKKILGVPIVIQENEPLSSVVSTSENLGNKMKNRLIDINLACEPDEDEEPNLENEKRQKSGFIRDQIDLNSYFSDCEEILPPSYESKSGNVKIAFEIDLEKPFFPENEDYNTPPDEHMPKDEQIQDEILRNAAKTMVSISSFCHADDNNISLPEASLSESLLWFVDACGNELERTPGEGSRPDGSHEKDEIDEFEAMTLKLEETKEEDYMPKPFCPEFPRLEDEVGPSNGSSTRPRRGQARRGRPRRDFQRDILPGLKSLSRHEVTEDIQTFGGLMRATGHSWTSGLSRRNGARNGAGRGRKRAVVETGPVISPNPVCAPVSQQHVNIEAGLEDRSLTGWGKTTRRPRRQRCHAGNNNAPAVVLT